MKRKPLKKILFSLTFILFCTSSFAIVDYKDQLSIGLGMVNNGYGQNAGAFDEDKGVASGSVSVISMDLNYEIFVTRTSSYAFRVTGSGMAGEVSKYYAVKAGRTYYFGADGASATFIDKHIKVTTTPIFRYYAGWCIGAFSMVYEPKKEVRKDTGIEIGGSGGILYGASSRTAYKFEATVVRGVGIETTSFNIQIFAGASFFIDSIF